MFAGLTRQRFELPECSRTQLPSFQRPPTSQFIHPTSLSLQLTARRTISSSLLLSAHPTSISRLPRSPWTSRRHWCSAHCAATRRSGFGLSPSPLLASSHNVLVSPTSLPRSLARNSHFLDPPRSYTCPTQPLHLHVFLRKPPKGVDNYDNPIENIECSDETYPRAT